MRVLFNTYPVAFDCPGGGEVMLLQSRAALERAGVEVLLYDPWKPQFSRVDVVHYFSVCGGSLGFCRHVKQRGLPLLISPILWPTAESLHLLPYSQIETLLTLADRVLPNSDAEQEQLGAHFHLDPNKVSITTNGIDATFAEPVGPQMFRDAFDLHQPYLLTVGNIEVRKNQLRLIEAVAGLEMPLVLIGRVRDQRYFQQCQQASRGNVRYIGHLEHGSPMQKSAYEGCAVFVLPSLLETPGLAALEAAALGARVVITPVGCTQEYFGDQVTYVDPLDVGAIRRGIDAALEQPADDALRTRVLRCFTWDQTARQLCAAYDLARRRAAA